MTTTGDGRTLPWRFLGRQVRPYALAVTGVRDDPEAALAALLTALDTAGLIDDQTTETA